MNEKIGWVDECSMLPECPGHELVQTTEHLPRVVQKSGSNHGIVEELE